MQFVNRFNINVVNKLLIKLMYGETIASIELNVFCRFHYQMREELDNDVHYLPFYSVQICTDQSEKEIHSENDQKFLAYADDIAAGISIDSLPCLLVPSATSRPFRDWRSIHQNGSSH